MEGLWVDASTTAPQREQGEEEGGESKQEEKVEDDSERQRESWGRLTWE